MTKLEDCFIPLNDGNIWGHYMVKKCSEDEYRFSSSDEDEEIKEEALNKKVKRRFNKRNKNEIDYCLRKGSRLLTKINNNKPPKDYSQKDRLKWIQKNRILEFWIQCYDPSCGKWRQLENVIEPCEVPLQWTCSLNSDTRCNTIQLKYIHIRETVEVRFIPGSIVLAKMPGYPWWPAIVDDDPEFAQFYWLFENSNIAAYYNVVFFDANSVTRSWVKESHIVPFSKNINKGAFRPNGKFKKRLITSLKTAKSALNLSFNDRLIKYSFVSRYTGPVYSYKHNIHRFVKENNLPPYSDTDSEEDYRVSRMFERPAQVKSDPQEECRTSLPPPPPPPTPTPAPASGNKVPIIVLDSPLSPDASIKSSEDEGDNAEDNFLG